MSETAEIAAVTEASKVHSSLDNRPSSALDATSSESLLERISEKSKKSGPEATLQDLAGIHESTTEDDNKDSEIPAVIKTKDSRVSEQDGKTYEFYDFRLPSGDPIKVVFKNREETIDPSILTEKHTVIIGDQPQYLPQEKYSQWQDQLDGKDGKTRLEHSIQGQRLAEFSSHGGQTMIVNQDPESLTQAALILGAKDPQVRDFYHQARNYQYSDELLQTIDTAIAAHVFKTDGTKDLSNSSHDAEALLVSSFLGDQGTASILEVLKTKYAADYSKDKAELDEQRAKWIADNIKDRLRSVDIRTREAKALEISQVAALHVTHFYPEFDEKLGKWKVQTNFNATHGKQPRTTVHFALNHVVAPNEGGEWDTDPIVIIAPLSGIIDENGLPESLSPADTFWNLNPGQDLVLPENALIIAPGEDNGEPLAQEGPAKGVQKLNYEPAQYDKSQLSQLKSAKRSAELRLAYDELAGLDEKIKAIVEPVRNKRDTLVEDKLMELGYEVQVGGELSVRDSLFVTRLRMLSDEIGAVYRGKHVNTPSGRSGQIMTEWVNGLSHDEFRTQSTQDQLKESKKEIADLWQSIPPQQRREMWALGLI